MVHRRVKGTSPRGRERFASESEREGGSEMRGKEGASRASDWDEGDGEEKWAAAVERASFFLRWKMML